MSKNQSGQFIGGFLLGAAVGLVTGILVAPRSGQQTRRLLKKSVEALPELAEDLSSTLQFQADRWSESTKESWDETLTRLREAIAAGIEAGVREHETLQGASAHPSPSANQEEQGSAQLPSVEIDLSETPTHYN